MQELSIFKIHEDLSKLLYKLNNDEDGIDEDEIEKLKTLEISLVEKFDGYAWYISTLENKINAIDEEIERLKELKNKVKGMIQKKENILEAFTNEYGTEIKGKKVFETDTHKFSFRKSSKVIIDDPDKLPQEYKKTTITVSEDKAMIKQAINEGKEVPGARIEECLNFNIS